MAKQKTSKAPGSKIGVWKPFFTLIRSVKMPWIWMLLALLFNLFGAQLALMIPDVASRIMTGDISAATITFMVVTTFLSAILTAVRQTVGRIGENKAEANFRKLMIEKTLNLPVPFYDRNMANLLITRTTTDCSRISEFLTMSIPNIPSTIYSFVGVFVVLFSYHWTLALLMAGMIPIILLVTIISGKVGFTWNNRLQGKVAELGAYLAEVLANIPLVKVFVKEKTEEAKGEQAIDGIYDAKKKYLVFASLLSTLTSAESLLQMLLIVLGGGYLVHHQIISLTKWIAFYGYSGMLVSSFQSILHYYETIKSAQGSARRMAEIIVEQSEDMGGDKMFPEQPQDLTFDHVTFRYDKDTILKGVSFTVPAGKTTALVGPSGAGKSTIFGLIERFYDPESGTVTLGGVDAKAYNKLSWRQAIGYVPQSSPMFSGTIRTNLTYGLEREVSEAELIQAAKDANIYEFIQSSECYLPN